MQYLKSVLDFSPVYIIFFFFLQRKGLEKLEGVLKHHAKMQYVIITLLCFALFRMTDN